MGLNKKELLAKERIIMFESDQEEYGTEVALYNYIWLLLDELFRGIGVTGITTEEGA